MQKAGGRDPNSETVKIADAAGGVQSLHRAVAILQSVAGARLGIGLAELSKELGLHSSTTFHLAKTLVTLGLMRQDPKASDIGLVRSCSAWHPARWTNLNC